MVNELSGEIMHDYEYSLRKSIGNVLMLSNYQYIQTFYDKFQYFMVANDSEVNLSHRNFAI